MKTSSRKLTILHIAPSPFFAHRGCHMRMLGEIESLKALGHRNVLCTYGLGDDVEGIETYRCWNPPWYKKLEAGYSPHKFYLDILLFFKALRVAWKIKPDIIHGHLHEGAFIGRFVRCFSFRKIPLVFDVQGSLTNELVTYGLLKRRPYLTGFFRWFERFINNGADFFCCSSVSNANFIVNMGYPEKKVKAIIDGVHHGYFDKVPDVSTVRASLGVPQDAPVVLFTGLLMESKGIRYLLDAMPGVLAKHPGAYFVLVGYPVEESRAYVEKLGIADRVKFTGKTNYFELPKYLRIADVAVDPKVDAAGEASGKMINYMGAGLVVVCFESENNRKFLAEGGIYAKDADSADLAAKISATLSMPKPERERISRMNAKRVQQEFSWDSSINALTDAYEALLSGGGITTGAISLSKSN